ncbi:MAG: Hsp20/alpha crystallin family protein [Candidatus Hodarchaeales archaeon]
MSMRIWDPFREIRRMQDEVSRIFNRSGTTYEKGLFSPLTDLYESGEEYIIKADLPGISKDDLDIEATSEYLEINAEHKEEKEEVDEEGYCCKERKATKYSRKIVFPVPVEPSKADIKLENGVLEIKIAKSEKAKAIKLSPK